MTDARVLIVEDEVVVAEALRRMLAASGYDVIGHAIDGQEAVDMARRLHPDVVLMDIVLGGGTSGIEAARLIQRAIDTSIVYVTGYSNDSVVSAAVRAGACGYVVKPFQAGQITSSIKIALHRRHHAQALEGRSRAIPPQPEFTLMLERLGGMLSDREAPSQGNRTAPATIDGLDVTPREKEIIRGLICYRRLTRVAEVLGISVHTARNHLKAVYRKLNLHSQDELIGFVLDQGKPSPFH